MTESINDELATIGLMKNFFLSREAILNHAQKIVGYKLLLTPTNHDASNEKENSVCRSALTAENIDFDCEKLFGGMQGFISVDAALLFSDAIHSFNNQNVVIEISDTEVSGSEIAERIAELAQAGFVFALFGVKKISQEAQTLLQFINIVKIDISHLDEESLLRLCNFYKQNNKRLIAEKVETGAQFASCLACGFDNFQGHFFANLPVSSRNKLSPSELSIFHLMELIQSEAENAEIEREIKRDVAIGLNLLRLVNTPATGVIHQIESIHQALIILGRRQLQRWLQILMYIKSSRNGNAMPPIPLLILASARGKLLELIAERLMPGNHGMADKSFTIGIMSLMDSLFNLPMEELLRQISVSDDVSDALLYRKGFFGEVLGLVESIEQFDKKHCPVILTMPSNLHLSVENFNRLQLIAFGWADQIIQDGY